MRPIPLRQLGGNHALTLELPKGPSHPCCNSRSSPTYPSPLKRNPRVPPISRVAPFPPASSRGGILSLRGRERIPGIPVASQVDALSTGKESSGSGTDSTQGLRPQHRRERNPERPPSNSHGDWPFLRPPDRVPEVPVLRREHLPQLENIQEVLPSRRDEAHFR